MPNNIFASCRGASEDGCLANSIYFEKDTYLEHYQDSCDTFPPFNNLIVIVNLISTSFVMLNERINAMTEN